MKKLLSISIICLVLHFTGNAQGTRFGITAGAAFANLDYQVNGQSSTDKTRTGLTFGVLADIPLSKSFSFQPAINYVQKGSKNDTTADGVTIKAETIVNTIEVPLNFVFNARGSSGNFFIGAGPTFAYALSGKGKASDGTNSLSVDLKFGSTADDDFKSMDVGANFMLGYCFNNGFMVSANYNTGLSNLMPVSSDGSIKSNYFGIKVGFMFK
jgi:hypothetical protein